MSDKYRLPREAKEKDVKSPFLVVCEGMSDVRFVCELLEHKGITTCGVGCPSDKGLGGGSGFDAIPEYLSGVKVITIGRDMLRGLLIMADADDEPAKRFSALQQALTDAGFPAPEKPFMILKKDSFRVAIYLVPKEGENGTLDCLLLEAALKNNPKMGVCLDAFCDCTGRVKSWTQNKQCKMKLSALVAASCEKNPWASAAIMWSEEGCPVPIDSDCFVAIANFLKDFTSSS
jgi:hypothetical protein